MSIDLPDFPWDALKPHAETAKRHPGGLVDLSVGSPVDPTPQSVRDALAAASDAPGYPQTAGTPELREAIVAWYTRRRGAADDLSVENVLPTIGSKEFITSLPLLLGLGPGDVVVQPTIAYPSYAIGAALARAEVVASDDPASWPENTKLIWLNSPGNPDGRVHSVEFLRAAVARARELDAVIANDECYAEFGWQDEAVPSILDARVTDGSRRLVLSVSSLSKQANLAGYRAGMVAGCSEVVQALLKARKHAGLMVPAPVQAAMVAALNDDASVAQQRELYRMRRELLRFALERAGFRVDASEGGLYLWVTRGEDSWATVEALAEVGVLVAPGAFYTSGVSEHVRISITVVDDRLVAAVDRLTELAKR
ncbi:succinyldiaminopimelate transaminase [Diaminobutyricimonas aerilata]|uniref:Aminotransferase n=1 Tax=Diaminobutyricimonas aerilata TaxID=1162967 RepID=A0A2M9CI81_9MICO|nr:succinyldiaminopimelate transaminase [Diaminobutyricimonas aerilata]PJJ71575.1 succinyldiaminopimelate transaminase [Diaminobutyricimonas aerilata]